ncbi:MAG TPA: hypothetical protein VHD83_00405 [Puia sp.]|nr:hypothetical protein [Puia sp.]
MIPPALAQFIEAYDYEDLDLGITRVVFDVTGFFFDLALKTVNQAEGEDRAAAWRVEAKGHRENRISFDYGESIRIERDHPLLWKYSDLQCDLYFNGVCSDPARLFYQMYQEHVKLFSTYIPFGTFLNMSDFGRFFQLTGGLVAKGPKKLLTRYAHWLEQAGVGWSMASERRAMHWDGSEYRQENRDLKILLLGQTETYIIAEDFQFTAL